MCFISVHFHSQALVEVSKIWMGIKRRGEETIETPVQIFNNALTNSSLVAPGKIPSKDVVHQSR